MRKDLREKAVRMRVERHMSYSAIAKALQVPKSTLSYWLHEYPLSDERILELRRAGWQKGEASRERYRNTMRKKREAKDETEYQKWKTYYAASDHRDLMIAGLMLYVGEGGKRKDSQLSLANTDPRVQQLFITWLVTCLGVRREEVRVQLHLYESMDIEKEHIFWQNVLRIQRKQFYKHSVRQLQPHSFTYSATHGHGTCSVYVFGVERWRTVTMATKALLESLERNMRD